MQIATLVCVLDQPHLAADHLHRWGLRDVPRGQQTLLELAETGLTLDLLARLCEQLGECLPRTPDPDAALEAFRRYLFAVRSPLSLAALFDRDPEAMPMLLAALSLGSRWANSLSDDPESFDLLRESGGQPIERATLLADVLAEVASFDDERSIVAALARIRRRHLLRIAYGDVAAEQPLATVLKQLSHLAEALVEAALAAAERKTLESKPLPRRIDLRSLRHCVIAVGQLGAGEADYALPLELLCVFDVAVGDAATLAAVGEHFDRVARQTARLLNEACASESRINVRFVTLPDSPLSVPAHTTEDVVIGFDSFGRTWHRQEMLKARAIAGDRELGRNLLTRLDGWLFRRYLGRADETGIKALKRRILLAATLHQDDWRHLWRARGGLGDIESTIAFLQLLAGGDQPGVRQPSTLAALAGLEQAGDISAAERGIVEETYTFLRRLAHRLQILSGPAAVELPDDSAVVERLTIGFGLAMSAAAIVSDLQRRQGRCWQVLSKLLTSAFPEEPPISREVELLLDPSPSAEEVRAALAPFGFSKPAEALTTLNNLASEQVPFLSTRRCRHLLATILPQLLCAVGATPQPDRTLDDLARVSNSLGGKGVLWDLFRCHPPSLQLYVTLCAASPYLSDILTTNPGMIDELVDSLQLDKLPTRAELTVTLAELCRGAADTLPILHDFKNAEHLRIGVRDILGKEDIDRTHAALADIAETCLAHVADLEYSQLVEKYGQPTIGPGPSEGEPCRLVIVALGKLGGREPNYHSHLDVLFLYEAEGTTRRTGRSRRETPTANNHFFTQLAQRIIKQLSQLTPKGRLYAIDALLRPIGIGGALALPFSDFAQHFAAGAAPLWQWQALCQARPVFGETAAAKSVAHLIRQLINERPWRDADMAEARRGRQQLEKGALPHNLKRGPGGTSDVEAVVQLLQLRHAANRPEVLVTNTQAAVAALGAAGFLSRQLAEELGDSYRFLRRVESGLRLLDTSARHDLPADSQELGRLALLLGHSNPDRLREQCRQAMANNRAAFNQRIVLP